MKRKKRNINEAFFIVTLVLIVILLLILIIKQLNNDPEFKITTEKCSKYGVNNETAIAKYEVLSSRESELRTDFNRENCDVLEKYGMLNKEEICVWLDTELKEINKQMSIPLKNWGYYEDVCEQVEVDEITYISEKMNKSLLENCSYTLGKEYFMIVENSEIFDDGAYLNVSIVYENNETNYEVLIDSRNDCSNIYERIRYNVTETILKEDLTIEWLDENADECLIDETYWVSTQNFGIFAEGECSKYKLQDYTIEVLN